MDISDAAPLFLEPAAEIFAVVLGALGDAEPEPAVGDDLEDGSFAVEEPCRIADDLDWWSYKVFHRSRSSGVCGITVWPQG